MLRAPVPVLQLSKLLGRVAHFSGVWVVCMRAVGGGYQGQEGRCFRANSISEVLIESPRTEDSTLPTASLTICPFGEVNDSITVRPYMELTPLSLSLHLHVFFPGIGCDLMDNVVKMTIDSNVDVNTYIDNLKEFLPGEETQEAFKFMKECFLDQSEETLEKIKVLQVILVCL